MANANRDSKVLLGSFEQAIGSLTGPSKLVARKILKGNFVEEMNRILSSSGTDRASAVKRLVDMATQKAASKIRRQIAVPPTIIAVFFALLALAISGNIVVPIVVAAILIAIIWLVTGQITKAIAHKASATIFKVIERSIT